MCYLIGTDEAGYGPFLGPLVIAATVWHLPRRAPAGVDLYELLQDAVVRQPSPAWADRVPIADSKTLYKAGGRLAALESGLYPAFAASGVSPSCWRDAWRQLAPDSEEQLQLDPWYKDYELRLPLDLSTEALAPRCSAFLETLDRSKVTLLAIRACAVFPHRFNRSVEQLHSKGAVLSRLTMLLVRELLEVLGPEPVLIQCDKHGGRNHYSALLQDCFPDTLVEVRRESQALSVYRWGPKQRRVEARFAVHGESFLPSALASMTAKYLRELAMKAFNAFWQHRIIGLRPTAGYPLDAARFLQDIDGCCQQLQISRERLWRNR